MLARVQSELKAQADAAKQAGAALAMASTDVKNKALEAMASELGMSADKIQQANSLDIEQARNNGLSEQKIERLTLGAKRIAAMQEGLRQVAALPDPVGAVLDGWVRPNGLKITRIRVPLGLIGIIYESRPNVTVDAAALCIKSGNSVLLRGGSEAFNSNLALVKCLQSALTAIGLPPEVVSFIESTDRAQVQEMMKLNGVIDCLIPRGGASLINAIVQNSTIPVIETGTGNCHVYVDSSADLAMAQAIVVNSKTQRTSVCNAAESLLIHRDVAEEFVPAIGAALKQKDVEIVGDSFVVDRLPFALPATEEDWYEEYLDLKISIAIVSDIAQAVEHINQYGSHHSDSIVTNDYNASEYFVNAVDSAAVYVNASTRFTDGFEFGFGAEIGISNQKLHARGPMGLTELTTYKYIIRGNGQVRE